MYRLLMAPSGRFLKAAEMFPTSLSLPQSCVRNLVIESIKIFSHERRFFLAYDSIFTDNQVLREVIKQPLCSL